MSDDVPQVGDPVFVAPFGRVGVITGTGARLGDQPACFVRFSDDVACNRWVILPALMSKLDRPPIGRTLWLRQPFIVFET
jgi:hypothetical protein